MSAETKPSAMALVTVQITTDPADGVEEHLLFRHQDRWSRPDLGSWSDKYVSRVRPLAVIAPDDREQVERLVKALSTGQPLVGLDPMNRKVVDEAWISHTQAALREFANPTPPKPDEPTGLGAVVEDADGHVWTLCRIDNAGGWVRSDGKAFWRSYDLIAAVRVLSDGVIA